MNGTRIFCLSMIAGLLVACGASKSGQVEVFHEFTGQGGGIRFEEFPSTEQMFNSDLSEGIVIRSNQELEELLKSRPEFPGASVLELEKAQIDFSKNMLIVVIRQDMYVPPKVTRVLRSDHSIDVYYMLPPLGETEWYARAASICTYRALEVKKVSLPVVFKLEK